MRISSDRKPRRREAMLQKIWQIVPLLCAGVFISEAYSSDSDRDSGMFKPPCYYGVFTQAIYDQTELLARVIPRIDTHTISDTELDELLIAHLYATKEAQVKQKIMGKLRARITCLEREADSEDKRALLRRILGGLTGAGGIAAGGVVMAMLPGPGDIIGPAIIFGGVMGIKGALDDILKGSSPEIRKLRTEIELLAAEEKRYLEGLRTEAVSAFEEAYVKKKAKIGLPRLQQAIETNLLDLRMPGNSLAFISREFLAQALCLPLTPKVLLSPDHDASLFTLGNRFDQDPFFRVFDAPVREALRSIVLRIAADSVVLDDVSIPLRGRYSFHGRVPGCGKTEAARQIARFLKLPYYMVTLRDATELNVPNLEGVDYYRTEPNVGWLLSPLLTPDESGRTHTNPILIIDEIDKILANAAAAGPALNVLLQYLEAGTVAVNSPYFRDLIRINRMTIILTGNNPLTHDAVLSRLTRAIEFPAFTVAQMMPILKTHLKALKEARGIPTEFLLSIELPTSEHPFRIAADMDLASLQAEYGAAVTYAPTEPIEILPAVRPGPAAALPADGAAVEENGFSIRTAKEALERAMEIFKARLILRSQASFTRALEAIQAVDRDAALHAYTEAAIGGHAEAACRLGTLLKAAPATEAYAKKWYMRGWDQGSVKAAYDLAQTLKDTDVDKAISWAQRAADVRPGVPYSAEDSVIQRYASYLLGELFEGDGQLETAKFWFIQAVQRGHPFAQRTVDRLVLHEQRVKSGKLMFADNE